MRLVKFKDLDFNQEVLINPENVAFIRPRGHDSAEITVCTEQRLRVEGSVEDVAYDLLNEDAPDLLDDPLHRLPRKANNALLEWALSWVHSSSGKG